MAYTALYRKLRPQLFSEVVGQAAIVQTLKNQLKSGRISHAYLFCGTRGTGKTTTARIFAKASNCPNLHDGEPCNTCEICRGIQEQRSLNVVEIDGASYNKVENVRDIRDEVKYPPTEGKYKVYIVDEVHMLTNNAFNALLKTLEEPPPHVVFVLATTDPQKLPATILSRCQRFDFKRISSHDIVKTLQEHFAQDNTVFEEDALRHIAGVADGALRDALSLADQCISFYYGEEITLEKVLSLLGAADPQTLFSFAKAIIDKNAATAIEMIQQLSMDGRDMAQFATDMIQHFRNLLVAAAVEKTTSALDYSEERVAKYREQGKKVQNYMMISYINAFSSLLREMKYASNPRVMLEIVAIRLCGPGADDSYTEVLKRIDDIEDKLKDVKAGASIAPELLEKLQKLSSSDFQRTEDIMDRNAVAVAAQPKPVQKAVPEDVKKVLAGWKDMVMSLDGILRSFMDKNSRPEASGKGITLTITDKASYSMVKSHLDSVKERILDLYGVDMEILLVLKEGQQDRPDLGLLESVENTLGFKVIGN
ncbi:MAG: DNA polymerase III subunit gamma/tau [Clostridiales bacterium]|jgi:DNA polymerase-3 subunit gamma/tau|nr:DNA polymerase III subunit gamma/tau [Clostridiales bacterium]MDR2749592.1 DNA polymerase III subunit gamma/tau [Clostridiales bacterium]